MTSWYSVSVIASPDAAEAIEYAFNSLEALGTEIDHLGKKHLDTVTVVGYFNDLPEEDSVQDELQYALRSYGLTDEAVINIERNTVEETDWLAEWKKHWKPSVVGRFVVAPPWNDVAFDSKIVIRIEPNMAFGTGTHETTQLCLKAIEKYYTPGDSFLDVGTGTGILAIAAAKLNANSRRAALLACDTDIDSVKIARKNAELNGVGNDINFQTATVSTETPRCDFVCANLTLDVIKPILPLLLDKAEKTLVLSGILSGQESEIVRDIESLGIRDAKVERAGEWLGVTINTT